MFEPTSTWPNLTLGKFSVVKKPIVNGGAIKPGGLLLDVLITREQTFWIIILQNVIYALPWNAKKNGFGASKKYTRHL